MKYVHFIQDEEKRNQTYYSIEDWEEHDSESYLFETEKEALETAESLWNHLTKREQERRIAFFVAVGKVNEDDGCFDNNNATVIKKYR